MEPIFETDTLIAPAKAKRKKPDDIRIAIVENDPLFSHEMQHYLEKIPGNRVFSFNSGEDCMRNYQLLDPEILILDYHPGVQPGSGGMTPLDVLDEVKSMKPETEVIFLSEQDNSSVAAAAIKGGASEYIIRDNEALRKMRNEVTRMSLMIRLRRQESKTLRWTLAITGCAVLLLVLSFFGGYEQLSLPFLLMVGAGFAIAVTWMIRNSRKKKRPAPHPPGERPGSWLD